MREVLKVMKREGIPEPFAQTIEFPERDSIIGMAEVQKLEERFLRLTMTLRLSGLVLPVECGPYISIYMVYDTAQTGRGWAPTCSTATGKELDDDQS